MNNQFHNISPKKVIRGENAWLEGKTQIPLIGNKVILLGRSKSTSHIRDEFARDLSILGVSVINEELKYDCCEIDLQRINSIAKKSSCDAIIATGGGKVLDAGKLIADRANLPCITIPLSASTCAGWTALSNIYTPKGSFIKDKDLKNCPELLIFDYSIVREAPKRLIASGIADALAKWYESSVTSKDSSDVLVQQAVQMARVLRDQLIIDGLLALTNSNSNSWVKVAESCSLTAGLIGGIGGSKCRSAAAHAVHNGLTQLNFSNKALHGELVGFGLLVQMRIEEINSDNELASQSKKQLLDLLKSLSLPTNLKDLGIKDISREEIRKACAFSCNSNSDLHNLPFQVDHEMLLKAIIDTDRIGQGLSISNIESIHH